MPKTLTYLFHFLGILLLQVLVVDQISFGVLNTYIAPLILCIVIFILPVDWKGVRLLIVAFVAGLILDAFHNTLGINASAMVVVAFLRPYILRTIAPREGFESFFTPNITTLPLGQYVVYSSLLFFSYHVTYFAFESLSYETIAVVFAKAIASSVAAIILASLYQYLTLKRK